MFRQSIRTLLNAPSFSAIAVLTIALGIAANTAIFSVVNAVLLRPLPFHDESAIVRIWTSSPDEPRGSHSAADFLDLQTMNRTLSGIAGWRQELAAVAPSGGGEAEQLTASYVTANFFDVLGASAREGRTFTQAQDGAARERLVVLSASAWEHAGANRSIGMPLRINGLPYIVVGVMSRGFEWPDPTELWLLSHGPVPPSPLDRGDTQDPLKERDVRYFEAVGRLKPGTTVAHARADLHAVAQTIHQQHDSGGSGRDYAVVPIRTAETGDVRPALLVIQTAVGLVLLIACANVSSLLIARATGRRRELAVRAAIGASRGHLVRQLLTESLLLGVMGGLLGLIAGSWLIHALLPLLPEGMPLVESIRMDPTVVFATLAASLGTGVLFGILPAIQASRADAVNAMKEGGGRGSARNRGRSALVVAEIALTLVLLVGAGLLMASFLRLQNVSSGFNPDHVTVASLTVPQTRYPKGADQARVFDRLLETLSARPEFEAVSVGFPGPLHGGSAHGSFNIEGRTPDRGEAPSANLGAVSGGYFATMGIPVLSGRTFANTDTSEAAGGHGLAAPPVAIVNAALARRYWPGQSPIGKRVRFDDGDPWTTIVGLVGDARQLGLDKDPPPILYVPYQALPLPFTTVAIRSTLPASATTPLMRSALASIDPDLAFTDIETLREVFGRYLGEPRFRLTTIGAFAVLALILAIVGVYGLISFSVAQRTREIGIRIALGASPSQVLTPLIREAAVLAVGGIAAGTIVAVASTRLLRSFLFEVDATDPLVFVTVGALLLAAAVAASYLPSRRALRVDPLVALRAE
jgi:putative ABC transport system permease protein